MDTTKPAGPATRRIAELMAEMISSELEPGDTLPKYAALAHRFGTSIATVGRAVGVLAADGLVIPQGMRWSPLVAGPGVVPLRSADEVAELLEHAFRAGTLVAGQLLPSSTALAEEYHSTPRCVLIAISRLAKRTLVHRQAPGRRPLVAGAGVTPVRSAKEVRALLVRAIGTGEFAEHEELPTYAAIADRFGTTKNTARTAVKMLAAEGLVDPPDPGRRAQVRRSDLR
jgi:DNA-binding GntR family transcriptional regulator